MIKLARIRLSAALFRAAEKCYRFADKVDPPPWQVTLNEDADAYARLEELLLTRPDFKDWRDLGDKQPRWRRYACADPACVFRCGEDETDRYLTHWQAHHAKGATL